MCGARNQQHFNYGLHTSKLTITIIANDSQKNKAPKNTMKKREKQNPFETNSSSLDDKNQQKNI